ncbi:MAG: FAD-dependent oxidoreductase [Acidimicrobiales bacterium]
MLRGRGVEVHLETQLESASEGIMQLSDGTVFSADTLVWATGIVPHALVPGLGLATDDRGRLRVDECLGSSGRRARGQPATVLPSPTS